MNYWQRQSADAQISKLTWQKLYKIITWRWIYKKKYGLNAEINRANGSYNKNMEHCEWKQAYVKMSKIQILEIKIKAWKLRTTSVS